MISLVNLTKQKSEKTYGSCQIMLEWISKQIKQQKCDKKWGRVKLCCNDFLSKSKKSEKTYGSCQTMLEWFS